VRASGRVSQPSSLAGGRPPPQRTLVGFSEKTQPGDRDSTPVPIDDERRGPFSSVGSSGVRDARSGSRGNVNDSKLAHIPAPILERPARMRTCILRCLRSFDAAATRSDIDAVTVKAMEDMDREHRRRLRSLTPQQRREVREVRTVLDVESRRRISMSDVKARAKSVAFSPIAGRATSMTPRRTSSRERASRRVARRAATKATDPPPPPDPEPGSRRGDSRENPQQLTREPSRWGLGPTRPQLDRCASHDVAAAAGDSRNVAFEATSPPSQALSRERSDPPGVAVGRDRARGACRVGAAS
jgi:hypothetical protein